MKEISALKILMLLPFFFGIGMLSAQVTIGAEAAPQPHSVLELFAQYETDVYGGLRLPQLTTAQRDGLGVTSLLSSDNSAYGLLIYNLDTHCIEYWNRQRWVSLCTGEANITFDCGDLTETVFLAGGGSVGPCTPHEDTECTEKNPPYTFTVLSGADYLFITILNEATSEFYVVMDENPTALSRSGIVRITNNCTLEYKDFIFTQEGNEALCTPGANTPMLYSYNGEIICSGGAVYLYLTGVGDGTGYVWTRNGHEIARNVNYYIATLSGEYRVYAGAIGCDPPSSAGITITSTVGGAPNPVSVIVGQNNGYVCSAIGETHIYATSATSGTIVWYKNGLKEPLLTGSPILAGIGKWFAVVEDGPCSSIPSNTIEVKLDPNPGTAIPTPGIKINGTLVGSTAVVCISGTLLLDVDAPVAGVTYGWYVNKDLVGVGAHFELPMAGITEGFVLQCRATNGLGCSSAGITEITLSSNNAPARPVIYNSTGTILCAHNATLYTNQIAASYRWYRNGVLLTETIHPVNTYTATTLGSYSLQTVVSGCVSEMSDPLNINENSGYGTVTITPQMSAIYENMSVQFTAVINPEDSESEYVWTITGGTPTTATGKTVLVTFGAPGTAFVSVTATNACTPGGVIDTVNGTAGITIHQNCLDAGITAYTPSTKLATIVGSGSVSLSVTPNGNTGNFLYEWFNTLNPGIILGYSSTFVTSTPGSYKCTVRPNCVGGNPITSDAFTVNAMTISIPSGNGNQTVCVNTALTNMVFTVTGATGATVSSSPSLPAGITSNYSAGTLTISGTPTASGVFNYSVTLTNGVTSGVAFTGTITVNAAPAQPSVITGTTPVCAGTTGLNYSVTNVLGATYNWVLPSGWTKTAGGTTNSIIVTAGTTGGTITVTPSANGCTGTARTLAVTVNTIPAQPSAITGNTPVCITTTGLTYSVTKVSNVTYNWTLPAGWTQTSGTTTNSIKVTSGTAGGTITVTPSNSCGNGTASTMGVTIYGPCVQNSFTTNTTNFVTITVDADGIGPGTATRTLTFLRYNLGANPSLTPKQQMAYPGCPLDMTVYGGFYQWGRSNINHTFRCKFISPITSDTHFTKTRLASVANDVTGEFIYSNNNWLTYDDITLWGSGIRWNYYTPGSGTNNPCPSGYRLPTEYEWALLSWEGGDQATPNNDYKVINDAITLAPSGLYWVKVNNGIVSSSFTNGNMCGYALYTKSDWESSSLTEGSNLTTAAINPLMFLPAAGLRGLTTGEHGNVGTYGYYWSSCVHYSTSYSTNLYFHDARVTNTQANYWGEGLSVRCIKN